MMGRTCAVSNPGYESIISMVIPMERRRPLLHVSLTITLRKRVSTPELLRKRMST